jgi:endonuclease/exonuclease/phosphatase (EEP) superfamily protein YafD
VLGLAVRLTVRDHILVANTIYYATPWSVLAVLGLVSAAWIRSRWGRRWAVVTAMAALGCVGMWCWTAWSFRPAPDDLTGARVITWNLGHGRWGLEGLAGAAANLKPDIAVFIEADPHRKDVRAIMKTAFPEHHVFLLGGGIVLISRWPGGEARAYEIGQDEVESRIREIDLTTPWGTWTVFGCDIASNTLYQREPHLRELASRIAACAHPVIVAGDFNTPLDSVHLDQLRKLKLAEAFETAGTGYLPTWPVPAPVLSLDQIWTGRQFKPAHCERRWNWRTDHAAVIAIIRPVD